MIPVVFLIPAFLAGYAVGLAIGTIRAYSHADKVIEDLRKDSVK